MSFCNDFDLWTVSPVSGSLSLSVHDVWSCQTDLPKSQLGSCHCLAKKSYDCPRSTKKSYNCPVSSRDFGGLLQAALCLAGGGTSRMIQLKRSFGLNRVLLQSTCAPGPEPLTHPTLCWQSLMPHSVTTVLRNIHFSPSENPAIEIPASIKAPFHSSLPWSFPRTFPVFLPSSGCL